MVKRVAKMEPEELTQAQAVELCAKGMTPGVIERGLKGAGLDYLRSKFTTPAAKVVGLAVHYGIISKKQAQERLQELYGTN